MSNANTTDRTATRPAPTPGEWGVGVYEITPTMRERLERPQACVCLANPDGTPGMVIALCGDAEDAQSQVDADLLAASKKMLAALKGMQRSLNGSAFDTVGMLAAHRAVDAAVDAAEGRHP